MQSLMGGKSYASLQLQMSHLFHFCSSTMKICIDAISILLTLILLIDPHFALYMAGAM